MGETKLFHGILSGVTTIPGYETADRRQFDKIMDQLQEELWDSMREDAIKSLESLSVRELPAGVWTQPPGFGMPPPSHSFICDMCERRFPNMDGWVHTYICSVCPECTVEFPGD